MRCVQARLGTSQHELIRIAADLDNNPFSQGTRDLGYSQGIYVPTVFSKKANIIDAAKKTE